LVPYFWSYLPILYLDKLLTWFGKLDISQFLQKELARKFTHLLNISQVMTLTRYKTLGTLFKELYPHFVLREMVYLFRQVGYFSISTKKLWRKFTHLLKSAQVMTLTSNITLATLFVGLSTHFVLCYLFRHWIFLDFYKENWHESLHTY
jgi:hypothetical protein